MAQNHTCKSCEQPLPPTAPEGLCPRCLLAGVMQPAEPDQWGLPVPTPQRPRGHWEAPEPQALDSTLEGRYRITKLLGRGGMGAVYRATDTRLDREVAIKVLPQIMNAAHPEALTRFQREARAMAALDHPNIVKVFDFGRNSDGHPYIVMELIDGADIHTVLKNGGLDLPGALEVVSQVCAALHYAHGEGIIHRDIKPSNILISSRDGRAKVADFGLAKALEGGPRKKEEPSLTRSDAPLGTPEYMAPEQRDGLPLDHRADIYALGATLYEILTGAPPRGACTPPSQKVQVDVRLDEIVLRALQENPSARYQAASEVKQDIDSVKTTTGGESLPPGVNPEPLPSKQGGSRATTATPAQVPPLPLPPPAAAAPSDSSLRWKLPESSDRTMAPELRAKMIKKLTEKIGRSAPVRIRSISFTVISYVLLLFLCFLIDTFVKAHPALLLIVKTHPGSLFILLIVAVVAPIGAATALETKMVKKRAKELPLKKDEVLAAEYQEYLANELSEKQAEKVSNMVYGAVWVIGALLLAATMPAKEDHEKALREEFSGGAASKIDAPALGFRNWVLLSFMSDPHTKEPVTLGLLHHVFVLPAKASPSNESPKATPDPTPTDARSATNAPGGGDASHPPPATVFPVPAPAAPEPHENSGTIAGETHGNPYVGRWEHVMDSGRLETMEFTSNGHFSYTAWTGTLNGTYVEESSGILRITTKGQILGFPSNGTSRQEYQREGSCLIWTSENGDKCKWFPADSPRKKEEPPASAHDRAAASNKPPAPTPRPVSPEAKKLYDRGSQARERGEDDRAIADLSQAIRLQPDYVDAHFCRGSVYHRNKQYQKAISDYDEAIKYRPDFAYAYHYRAGAYLYLGNKAQAAKDEKMASKLFEELKGQ